ncbi:MAG: exodeoxyribonuclease V subunit gamma [Deltaproteobacteria bacterium]|nr:exodeoxyribonuclease V subunit gamma [Deltaproteobacteria bacterium]
MLFIYRSNYLEELLGRLAVTVSVPQTGVMVPETIIVQSQGMARWLSLQLAGKLQISANLDCAFPAAFIWRLLRHMAADEENMLAAYEPDSMLWAIMELLTAQKNNPDYGEVAGYLANDANGLRRWQLAARLAALFDKYMAYRPDWFRQWPADMSRWQADLWQIMAARYGTVHRAAMQDRLLRLLKPQAGKDEPNDIIGNLERLSIFGIPALPPSQFAVLARLSELLDVHLFLLAPCREFWTDLVSARTMAQARLAGGGIDPNADLHFEEGCPLLLSMGSLGREFQILLQDSGVPCLEDDFFVESGGGTALALLQDDILNGRNSCINSPDDRPNLAADDHSLTIQVTHSPMREVEILYDQLLDWLTDTSLEPGDILVMTPDINLYAPLVDAVFANPEDAAIPFTIADGPVGGAVIRGFLALLALNKNAGASEIMALLQYEPLRARFAVQAQDLETLEVWIRESGIKWGLERKSSPSRHGSWLAGLERLLMGYICGGVGLAQVTGIAPQDVLVDDILPCDVLEGGDGVLLANLLNFVGALRRLLDCPSRSLAAWADFFSGVLDDFFIIDDDNLRQSQTIRRQLAAIQRAAAASGSAENIDIEVIKAHLREKLAASQGSGNFLCGRVTFCQMAPMRSIPFPVICLLGMNDNAFPRHDRPLSFDLMAQARRPGDRSRRRADDRYLFLETIISARRNLYISYMGLGNRDGRQLPPSVLVSELLDHLGRRLGLAASEVERRFMVWHPLQPFSRRYFTGSLYSYCRRNREMAGCLGMNRPWEGLGKDFTLKQEACDSVLLADFIDFFAHPVRFLLRRRLGVTLDDYYDKLDDREPFGVDHLSRYKITGELTEINLTGRAINDEILAAGQQRGQLPEGETGRFYFENSRAAAGRLAARLHDFTAAPPMAAERVQLDLTVFTLSGSLDHISAAGQYLYRPIVIKSMKYKDYVQGWIYHLLLCALRPDLALETVFIGLDGRKAWPPMAADKAMANLRELAGAFAAGQYRPLPLYPKSTLAYAKARWAGRKKLAHTAALERAENVWSRSGYYDAPENTDPYFTAAFGFSQLPLMAAAEFNFISLAELLLAAAV